MSWLDDIIKSLPSEYEELARMYLTALKRMGREEALEWLDYLRIDDEANAHDILIRKMTTEEIATDGDRGNEILQELNKGNAEKMNLSWHILRMLVTIGLDKPFKRIEKYPVFLSEILPCSARKMKAFTSRAGMLTVPSSNNFASNATIA